MPDEFEAKPAKKLPPALAEGVASGEVLRYRNELLCTQIQKNLCISHDDAKDLFLDLKYYLSLSLYTDQPLPPPRAIDKAWHEFILMTKDYAEFCQRYFGKFVHHQPSGVAASAEKMAAGRRRAKDLAAQIFGNTSKNWD